MLRVIVVHFLLFLLPFIAYGVWLMIVRRSASAENWRDAPMLWLSLIGGVIVIVSLVMLASFEDDNADATYTPMQYENGKLVPGKLE
ncbi:hypothetical protein C8N35_11314 [Breoghania corrubedonensis]|uniref:Uncharacterized protein n=1 Tax=Breoghania corrubedonensis TaxID=665038 RepID=A0A2T5UU03_9HYPH|nr:DUF6111 family protein [Breoghania corrubedonensis]PTW54974.1 hypothetical protein C8N35_11314 [Breoghania corrubedonensis]